MTSWGRFVVLCLVVVACKQDRFGTYIQVKGPAFDQLEFFFGGQFPSRRCGNQLASGPPPALNSTASWQRRPNQEARLDTMWRRQFSPNDVRTFTSAQSSFDYYVPSAVNDPVAGFTDTLGKIVVIIARRGAVIVGIAYIASFVVEPGKISKYPITLAAPSPDLEVWGTPATEPSCLRVTTAGVSTFIVREGDHDCDGLLTRNCDYDGLGAPVDDCDPLTYCHGDTNAGCVTSHEGCFIDPAPGSGTKSCQIAACTNERGSPVQQCQSPLPFCLDENACGVHPHCDRLLLDCVLIDTTPDLVCKVPVSDGSNGTMRGSLCPSVPANPLSIVLPWPPNVGLGCGGVVKQTPLNWQDVLNIKTVVRPATTADCRLDIAPVASLGVMPVTRVLVAIPEDLNKEASFLIELTPDQKKCSDNPMPQCDLASAPLGTPHSCP